MLGLWETTRGWLLVTRGEADEDDVRRVGTGVLMCEVHKGLHVFKVSFWVLG